MSAGADLSLLFTTRCLRMIAYGIISIILALYLESLGFSKQAIGRFISLTMIGDTVISLWLTTRADRFGRKKTLVIGSLLMLGAGIVFATTQSFWPLLIAATIGVISPNGKEVGPFLAIEQAALTHIVSDKQRTHYIGWYTVAGAMAAAVGAQLGGWIAGWRGYSAVILVYAGIGGILGGLFAMLSPAIEVDRSSIRTVTGMFLGLHRSRAVVMKLSALFALDAFAGGFVMDALAAYWFKARWNVELKALGTIFLGANILAAISALLATRLARRFGLINTMVFTHLPSNVLLVLVPLMPSKWLAIAVLWLRFSISQMDVPTRQSYTMAVVDPDERAAAAGVTGVARSVGVCTAPFIVGWLFEHPHTILFDFPFYLGGALKIVYDVLLYRSFIKHRPPEESR